MEKPNPAGKPPKGGGFDALAFLRGGLPPPEESREEVRPPPWPSTPDQAAEDEVPPGILPESSSPESEEERVSSTSRERHIEPENSSQNETPITERHDDGADLDEEEWGNGDNESPKAEAVTLEEAPGSTESTPAYVLSVGGTGNTAAGFKRFVPSINWLPEFLVDSNRIPRSEMEKAVSFHRQYMGKSCFSATLIKLEMLGGDEVLSLLQQRYNLPKCNLSRLKLDAKIFDVCPSTTCSKHMMLAYKPAHGIITVVLSAPSDDVLRESRQIATRNISKLIIEIANESSIRAVIQEITEQKRVEKDGAMQEIRQIFVNALDQGSSDVHFEPLPDVLRVRYRIDGLLTIARLYPKNQMEQVLRSVQVYANLDLGQPNIPQDQELEVHLRAKTYKLRVSSIPSSTGHSIVARLLDKEAGMVQFKQLGIEPDHEKLLEKTLSEPEGAIIMVGPTGSGKSTSMLSMLSRVDGGSEKIVTIENPPEYRIGQSQQIKYHKENISFAAAVRCFMRQDPDNIMIGEIRDQETAEAAITSALTGHKVFSTVHGPHALVALQRFADWKVDYSSMAQGISLLIAQRLLPKLCPHCRIPDPESRRVVERHKIKLSDVPHIFNANLKGCPHCTNGFRGRIGAFEFVPISVDEDIKDLVTRGGDALIGLCQQNLIGKGYRFMREDAFLKVGRGLTTVQQVLANVPASSTH